MDRSLDEIIAERPVRLSIQHDVTSMDLSNGGSLIPVPLLTDAN